MRAKFINEKFTEESDPVRDMGIGAKFVYYRIYKLSTDDSYNMFLYGSTYDTRDIIKRYNFNWDDFNYAWKSRVPFSMEKWKSFAKEMFDELEKAGYVVQPKGKLTKFELDFKRSFLIPGYEQWEYPYIPDGNNLKVYFKQWHHHAPIIGVTGKGSYIGKDVLRYDGYQFNRGSHMWERIYDKEDVDDLIEYFKSRGYQVIDGRKKINEKFQEKSDPIKDMGIGVITKFIKQLKKDAHNDEDIVYAYEETIRKFNRKYPGINWQKVFDELPEDALNEKFQEKSDPIKDMGIGKTHLIYDITPGENEGEFNFRINTEKIVKSIKKHIHGISSNEINRFCSFTLRDIFDKIPERYFENNDLDNIDKYIEQSIWIKAQSWMNMHSDKAMKASNERYDEIK